MKADYKMDLVLARKALEAYLLELNSSVEIGNIVITSYDKPKIVFHEDGLVEAEEFKHRIRE